jgi:MATE family multidrug resistance protein
VDIFFVGRLGKEAIAAAGIALTLFGFVAFSVDGLFDSVVILGSAAFGANDRSRLRSILRHATLSALGLGIIAMAAYFPLSFLFSFLTQDPVVLRNGRIFLAICCLSFIPTSLNWVLPRFLMSVHRTRALAVIANITVAANIVLDWLLIFGNLGFPKLGVIGAAVATLVAKTVSVSVTALYLRRVSRNIFGDAPVPSVNGGMIRELFLTGFPIAQTNFLEVSAWTVFVSVISRLGTAPIAAHQIGMKIKDVIYVIGSAVGDVTTTLVAHDMGRMDVQSARKDSTLAVRLVAGVMGSVSLLFFFFPEFFISLFSRDPDVILAGTDILRIMALYQLSDAVFIVYRAALNGMNDTRFVRNVILLGGWFVMVPVALLLTHVFRLGAAGAWVGLTIYVTMAAILYARRFLRTDWKKKRAVTVSSETRVQKDEV